MAIAIRDGSQGRSRRKVWPAASARAMAVRWFEQVAQPRRPNEAGRCAWCRGSLDEVAIGDGAALYCSHDCAAAVRIAGLYLG